MKVKTLTCAVAILLSSLGSVAASDDPPSDPNNPGNCTIHPEGRAFIRLQSGYHFAFPREAYIRYSTNWEPKPELPSNETEPVGCPDNPAVAGGFRVRWPSTEDESNELLENEARPISIVIAGHDGPFEAHKKRLATVDSIVGDPKNWRVISDDLLVYRGTKVPDGYFLEDGQTFLRAIEGSHPLSMGLAFQAHCQGAVRPNGAKVCLVIYGLAPGLSVKYRFSTDQVAEFDVLRLDKQVRGYVAKHQLGAEECDKLKICGAKRWDP